MNDSQRGESNLCRQIRLACLLEATARKAGNVHPGVEFEHLCYADFVASAEAVAPVLAQTPQLGVGPAILEAVRATRECCDQNTNLGIILLLAPLCAVPAETSIADGIATVLDALTQADAESVYEAIRLASPRGLGASNEQDVALEQPVGTLKEVMALAADRDSIAAQYCSGFDLVLKSGPPTLTRFEQFNRDWEHAVIRLQLDLMSIQPDTDILRKCGRIDSIESSRKARAVLCAQWPTSMAGRRRFKDFDFWLRARSSQRNPGTTADLVTACLFVALRDGLVATPSIDDIRHRADAISNGTATPVTQ